MISRVLGVGGWVLEDCESEFAKSPLAETVLLCSAVLGMNPSCSHLRHDVSKSVGALTPEPGAGAPASCGRFAGVLPASLLTRSLPLAVLPPFRGCPLQ